jgi:hypothetical protein
LSGVFLLPLGLPWVLPVSLFAEPAWPALTIGLPIWLAARRQE